MSCIAPAGSGEDKVAVSVSLNGVDFVESRASFRYTPEVSLMSLQPPSGPAGGGTTVRIAGSNFVFFVRFGVPLRFVERDRALHEFGGDSLRHTIA